MALAPGARIGVFEVTGSLGAGGMGEVYRARDTKLGRDVALKILPELFATDSRRLARFQREAQVLASLNHSNIAAIYGLEETDSIHALVLELVEGETLADRIVRDPIPLSETLQIARQITEAVETAHEQGIIHRDLKPSNIKLRPDGTVKVLDFGLAKALNPDSSSDLPPTRASTSTDVGMILGTAPYMSPEQVGGQSVDRRTDIWAFGCVLYEMLTGHRAFRGETFSDTIVAVLEREPDWHAVPDETPQAVRRLVQRCLQKDRRLRLRDIGDARLEIDEALLRPAETTRTGGSAAGKQSRAYGTWVLGTVLGLVLTALAAVALMRYAQPGPSDAPVTRFVVGFPDGWRPVSDMRGSNLAVSPDGRWVAFLAIGSDQRTAMWVRELGSVAPRMLPGTVGAMSPFWSPDGRFLGFFADAKLKKIHVASGDTMTVCEVYDHAGGTWGSDQVIVFATLGGPLHRVSAFGGTPTATSMLTPGEVSHLYPSFLPDGRRVLYGAINRDDNRVQVYVISLDGTDRALLPVNPGALNVAYSRQHLLFVRQNTLVAQPFDERRLTLGEAFPIAENVRRWEGPAPPGFFAASANGVLVYQSGSADFSQLIWYDRSGKQLSILGESAVYFDVRLSPRGDQVAVSIQDPGRPTSDVWLYDVARGVATRFTSDPGMERGSIWSPDGSQIIVTSTRTGTGDLYQKPSDSAEAEESVLFEAPLFQAPEDWAPDGESILFGTNAPSGKRDLWMLPLSGDRKPVPVRHGSVGKIRAGFSPDGRWIVYQGSDGRTTTQVYVAPFGRPGPARQLSTDGGYIPKWSRDGTEIFFLDGAGRLVAATVDGSGDALKIQGLQTLFQTRAKPGVYAFDVAPSGDRFLINTVAETSEAASFTVVVNWPAALEK